MDYEILVNGTPRTYRDKRQSAEDAAQVLKRKSPGDQVQVKGPDGTVILTR